MAERRKTAFSGIVPYLAVNGGFEAIAFYEMAFGAELVERMPAPDGRLMHAHMQLNNAPLFLHDDFDGEVGVRSPTKVDGPSVTMHLALASPADVNAVFARARGAGAEEIMALHNAFWSERYARLRDPFGHVWSLGAPVAAD